MDELLTDESSMDKARVEEDTAFVEKEIVARRQRALAKLETLVGGPDALDEWLEKESNRIDETRRDHLLDMLVDDLKPGSSSHVELDSAPPRPTLRERLFANYSEERLRTGRFDPRCDEPRNKDPENLVRLLQISDKSKKRS